MSVISITAAPSIKLILAYYIAGLVAFILSFDPFILTTIHCDSTDLVQSGSNLGSTVGKGIFTKLVSSIIHIPPHIYGIIVGLILGDAWISFGSKANKNARLGFQQSLIHFPYFWSVFTIFSHYCSSLPYLKCATRKGITSFGTVFQTRSLPCFTELHTLFYIAGVKVIPEIIFELLTPVALAHWIICDGSTQRSRLILCTDSYTIQEVVLLMNVLIIKFQLECNLRYHGPNNTRPRIYIRQGSIPLLRSIVLPYMHPSMLNKIHAN